MSKYTCCKCNKTYKKRIDKGWNDLKAAEELLTLYPETKNHPTDILCDKCNERFEKWFATLTEAQKLKMRQDFENGY